MPYLVDAEPIRGGRWAPSWPVVTLVAVGCLVLGGCGAGTGAADTDAAGTDGAGEAIDFPLPTSGWQAGDIGQEARLSGILELEDQECLVVSELPILWPADFTATMDPDGVVRVFNPDGREVARTGTRIVTGGGADGPEEQAPCQGNYETYFSIQDTMEPLGD